MQKKLFQRIRSSVSAITMLTLLLGTFGIAGSVSADAPTVTVTIAKYIDGVPATASNAANADFTMSASWNATNIGAGTGEYSLSAGNPVAYQAQTTDMTSGAAYATSEVMGSVVSAACDTTAPFSLVGYTTGDTLAAAAGATPTMTPPSLTDITSNKYVIVWNHDCSVVIPTPPTTVTVTIEKYVDGAQATASTSKSSDFPMNASWNDPMGIGAGSGQYALSQNGFGGDPTPYQAKTVAMNVGSDYATSEATDGTVVGASCDGSQLFSLVGYTTGDTLAAAAAATATTTAPSFTGLTSDTYVIVWNKTCATNGTISGTVDGTGGALAVTSVEAVDTAATADGTYGNGWKYLFHITLPSSESNVALKFADWTSGLNLLPVAGNMRISSAQADNAGATIDVLAANTYTTPNLHMTMDLDPLTAGIQVDVMTEVRIPVGTANGSFSTNYGVKSQ